MGAVNIKMYKAQDSIDGCMSMFVVCSDGRCAISYFSGDHEPWLDYDLFMSQLEDISWSREEMAEYMICPELIWCIDVESELLVKLGAKS